MHSTHMIDIGYITQASNTRSTVATIVLQHYIITVLTVRVSTTHIVFRSKDLSGLSISLHPTIMILAGTCTHDTGWYRNSACTLYRLSVQYKMSKGAIFAA